MTICECKPILRAKKRVTGFTFLHSTTIENVITTVFLNDFNRVEVKETAEKTTIQIICRKTGEPVDICVIPWFLEFVTVRRKEE